ncbi:RNA helicase domain-containing protein [Mobiluncus mulieris]|uniref:RNA helicase domain-containing protein n=1 Tax=Mobiluncus mulieris TaxID=2052 RepID=UPI0021E341BA|nr:RNA helicase domain-containing protein [Mobiluncus mulieris]MCV0002972.1 hypothetical protein [Mobiluncus mulieris]
MRATRDWMLTIPASKFDKKEVENRLKKYQYIGQLEKGKTDTEYLHWQVFVHGTIIGAAIRFDTLRNKFDGQVHLEPRCGTILDCINYVTKLDTAVAKKDDDYEYIAEHPELSPIRIRQDGQDNWDDLRKNARTKSRISNEEIYQEIISGKTAGQIINDHPELGMQFLKIKALENGIKEEQFRGLQTEDRENIEVNYLWGPPGAGKSWHVLNEAGYDRRDIYRKNGYQHVWDNYQGQRVLILEDFTGQIGIEELLQVTDIYATELDARYSNHYAGWEVVWIISNLRLDDLLKKYPKELRPALVSRITNVYLMEDREMINQNELWAGQLRETREKPWLYPKSIPLFPDLVG